MKVAIVGSEGLLGSALMKEFSAHHETVGLDRAQLDVTDEGAIRRRLAELRPNVVLNATAYNGVDAAEENAAAAELAASINGAAVGYLAAASKNLGIPLVHYSTDYVFDGAASEPYPEDAAVNPINTYGKTKAHGEHLLSAITNQFYLIRLSRLFGPPGVGASAKKSFVDIMLDLVEKQGKTELKLVAEEVTGPTYSVDVARLTRTLCENKAPYGIYHGANSGQASWFDFANEIFKLKGLTVKTIPVKSTDFPRPAKRPLFSVLKNTKLPRARSWQEALAEYLAVS